MTVTVMAATLQWTERAPKKELLVVVVVTFNELEAVVGGVVVTAGVAVGTVVLAGGVEMVMGPAAAVELVEIAVVVVMVVGGAGVEVVGVVVVAS